MSAYRMFADYAPAEREADQVAGDTRQPMAVVEDFAPGDQRGGYPFTVRPLKVAEEYVVNHDAAIQYTAILVCQTCEEPEYGGPHDHADQDGA